jgi:signal transduction histidine kinase
VVAHRAGGVDAQRPKATQNALKHAADATGVWIKLSRAPHRLRFEVRDDGPGFTLDDHDGRGLRNMHDRIEACGGDLTVETSPGPGTRVAGSVELPSGDVPRDVPNVDV